MKTYDAVNVTVHVKNTLHRREIHDELEEAKSKQKGEKLSSESHTKQDLRFCVTALILIPWKKSLCHIKSL